MTTKLIPVTILTGFLGSGKTTLLNYILKQPHGHRIAVIENEFGEAGIDNELLVQDQGEQIIEMNNGCICCTMRGDLVRILGELAAKRKAGTVKFDSVVIETTGLADPAPVAQTFLWTKISPRISCWTPSLRWWIPSMRSNNSTSTMRRKNRWVLRTVFC
jgi:G3E family GTPase